jgi:hypothetical protein
MTKNDWSNTKGLVAGTVRAIRTVTARWRRAPAERGEQHAETPAWGSPVVAADPRPKTLKDLGVADTLARDLEDGLEQLGAIDGNGRTAWTFRTPDGVRHALRVETDSRRGRAPGRAA